MRRTKLVLVLTMAFVVALMAAVGIASAKPAEEDSKKRDTALRASAKLRKAVDPAGILVHERRFQRIANANDGTRASGTPGYDASVDYVANKLRRAGYRVEIQNFEFPFFEVVGQSFSQTAPEQRDFEPADPAEGTGDYEVMSYSGSGAVEDTPVVPTDDVEIPPPDQPGVTSGCEASDFPAGTEGKVALIQRGSCTFAQKAQNAEEAGATAALIFNEGQEDRTDVVAGTLGEPGVGIPVVGISYELGKQLFEAENVRVSLDIETESEVRETSNVLADTRKGRSERTIVVGRPPRLRNGGSRYKRQRLGHGGHPGDRRRDGPAEREAGQQGALRLLGGRGVGASGLRALRLQPLRGRARRHSPQPQLRHDRLAELRALYLRRRRLEHAGRRTGRLGPDRAGLQALLPRQRPPHTADPL